MSINPEPPAASPSSASPRKNPCFGINPKAAMLQLSLSDGHDYLLSYAQLLHAERMPNPALEKDPGAPPEKLRLRFADAEVILLGNGLSTIERETQTHELGFVKAIDQRYASTLTPYIASVSIKFIEEAV